MIVSVHLPKTGGCSFKHALREHYGKRYLPFNGSGLMLEKDERNKTNVEESLRLLSADFSGVDVVHGHFMPFKFLLLAEKVDLNFVVWLRDPFERMASHFYFWRRAWNPRIQETHWREVILGNWSFEDFCFSDRYRNFISQYLWAFPLYNFDFIGSLEHYAEDLKRFSDQFVGADLDYKCRNRTANKPAEFDEKLKQRFAEFHAIDYELYRQAMKIRERQVDEYQSEKG